jgi:hypothetical protein
MKFPSFMHAAPAASHWLSMLGLVAPDNLHLATACVHVVALAGAAKAKAMRAATVINRRMNGVPSESLALSRWLDKPVVWSGCSSPPILVALPTAASGAVIAWP